MPSSSLPWSDPEWRAEAESWIEAQLVQRNLRLTASIEQPHLRPWSTVLRVPTSDGDLYFKATAPSLAHETALTHALSHWYPDCMPDVLAADPARA